MIMPIIPSKLPHTDNDNSIMAGFSPISFPMMWGVIT